MVTLTKLPGVWLDVYLSVYGAVASAWRHLQGHSQVANSHVVGVSNRVCNGPFPPEKNEGGMTRERISIAGSRSGCRQCLSITSHSGPKQP